MTLPSSIGGPTTHEVGYFDHSPEHLARWLADSLGQAWVVESQPQWNSWIDAVRALAPRALLGQYAFVALGSWAVLLNDGPRGTDVGVLPSLAARQLGCRAIRAVCVEDGYGYPARILTVFGPDGTPPLAIERSIVAANDGGRWVFEASGNVYEFEEVAAYLEPIKQRRFTCERLYSYLRHLGVPIDDEPDWAAALIVRRAHE